MDTPLLAFLVFIVFPALTGWYYAGKHTDLPENFVISTQYYIGADAPVELKVLAVGMQMLHWVIGLILLPVALYNIVLQFIRFVG